MKTHAPGFLQLVEALRPKVVEVDPDESYARLKSRQAIALIDVREDNEFARDACLNAVHLGKGIIERDIEMHYPDRAKQLILYCGGGYRSVLAAHSLQQMGYQNVSSMKGGIRAWQAAGLPMRKAQDAST